MRSIVLIFVPCGDTRREFEVQLQKPIDAAESIEDPATVRSKPVEDADQLPLWKWFTF